MWNKWWGRQLLMYTACTLVPIPAKNDWMLLVQRMFSYLKQGWTVMKWNIKTLWTTTNLLSCTSNRFSILSWQLQMLASKTETNANMQGRHKTSLAMYDDGFIFIHIWDYLGICQNVGNPKTNKNKKNGNQKDAWKFPGPKVWNTKHHQTHFYAHFAAWLTALASARAVSKALATRAKPEPRSFQGWSYCWWTKSCTAWYV